MIITALAYLVFLGLLVAVAVVDLRTLRIPNVLTASMLVTWVIWRVALFVTGFNFPLTAAGGFVGSLLLGGALLVTTTVYEAVTKKRAMGGGDIKLLFAVGLFLGIRGGVICLLVACVVSILLSVILPRVGWVSPYDRIEDEEGETPAWDDGETSEWDAGGEAMEWGADDDAPAWDADGEADAAHGYGAGDFAKDATAFVENETTTILKDVPFGPSIAVGVFAVILLALI